MTRSLLFRLLLAFTLLLAQQVGVAHGTEHARGAESTHEHGKGVVVKACDQCLAAAQIQPAPGTVAAMLPPIVATQSAPTTSTSGDACAHHSVYRSRAPPAVA